MPVDLPEREKFARQVSQLCHQAFPYGEAKAGPLEPDQLTTDFHSSVTLKASSVCTSEVWAFQLCPSEWLHPARIVSGIPRDKSIPALPLVCH